MRFRKFSQYNAPFRASTICSISGHLEEKIILYFFCQNFMFHDWISFLSIHIGDEIHPQQKTYSIPNLSSLALPHKVDDSSSRNYLLTECSSIRSNTFFTHKAYPPSTGNPKNEFRAIKKNNNSHKTLQVKTFDWWLSIKAQSNLLCLELSMMIILISRMRATDLFVLTAVPNFSHFFSLSLSTSQYL